MIYSSKPRASLKGKSNERILCKLSKFKVKFYGCIQSFMLRWKLRKRQIIACQSESFISIFFTCQVPACELQPFSCHDLANDIFSQTVKTVLSHLKVPNGSLRRRRILTSVRNICEAAPISLFWSPNGLIELPEVRFQ